MKKIWLLMATIACTATAGTFTACGGTGTGDSDVTSNSMSTSMSESTTSNEENSSSVDKNTPSITMSQEFLKMDVYQTKTISVFLQNLEGEIEWSSSDESIAVVEAGSVIAKKEGTVTIMATVGEYSASCEVIVEKGTGVLEFADIRDFSLIVGKSQQLDATVVYGEDVFPFTEVAFALESGKDLISITEDGTVTSNGKVGTQKVMVTATFNGKQVVQQEIEITIYEHVTINTGIFNNQISLVATEKFDGALKTYLLDDMQVLVNGEEETEAQIALEIITGDEVISLDSNNLITALAAGEATIKASFISQAGSQVETTIIVTVAVPDENGNQFFVENNANYEAATVMFALPNNQIVFDVSELDIDSKDVDVVKVADKNVAFNVVKGAICFTWEEAGEYTLVVESNGEEREYAFISSDCVIDSFADFRYYMTGVTEGQSAGYNINKNRAEAMYAVVTADIEGSHSAASSYACSSDVSGAHLTAPKGSVFNGFGHTISGIYCSTGWFGYTSTIDVTLKNVHIDDFLFYGYSAFGYLFTTSTVENVTMSASVVAPDNGWGFFNPSKYGGGSWLTLYPYGVSFINSKFAFWAPEGHTDKEMLLFWDKGYYNAFFNEVEVYTNGKIAETGEQNHAGETVGDKAFAAGSSYTVYDADAFKANGAGSSVAKNNGKTIDKNALGNIGTIKTVLINGRFVPFVETDENYTFERSVGGEKRYVVTDKGAYLDTTVLCDLEISTAEQFRDWFYKNRNLYQYVVLKNDINLGFAGNEVGYFEGQPVGSTFNGMGYKVSNLFARFGLLGHGTSENVTIKNVTFDKLYFRQYSVLGADMNGVTLENVTINAQAGNMEVKDYAYYIQSYTALLAVHANNLTLKGCTINVDWATTGKGDLNVRLTRGGGNLTLIDTNIYSNGLIAKPGESVAASECGNDGNYLTVVVAITADSKNYTIKDKADV